MGLERGAAFREKLRYALQRSVGPTGEPYSYRELAAAIRAKGYDGPSAAYLNQLVTGVRSDPKLSYVQAIAAGLGIPVSFFLDDDPPTDRDRATLDGALGVELMAARAGELSERGRRQVMEILDLVYRLEHGEGAVREDG